MKRDAKEKDSAVEIIDIRRFIHKRLFSFRVHYQMGSDEQNWWLERVKLIPACDEDWFVWTIEKGKKCAGEKMQSWTGNYLRGVHLHDVPFKITVTPFVSQVLEQLEKIELGKTATYKELADYLGLNKGYQSVARGCSMNPLPIFFPCHRVVGANGWLGGYSVSHPELDGIKVKKELLMFESSLS